MSKKSTYRSENEIDRESKASAENGQFMFRSFNCDESSSSSGSKDFSNEQISDVSRSPPSSLDEELYGINDAFNSNLRVIKEKLRRLNINFNPTHEAISLSTTSNELNGFCEERRSFISERDVIISLHNAGSSSLFSTAFMDNDDRRYRSVFPTIEECPELESMDSARSYEIPEKKICLRDAESCVEISNPISTVSTRNNNERSSSSSNYSSTPIISPASQCEVYVPPQHLNIPIPISCFEGNILAPFLINKSVQCSQEDIRANTRSRGSSCFELGLNLPSSIGDDCTSSAKSTPIEPKVVVLDNDNKSQHSIKNIINLKPSRSSKTTFLFKRQDDSNSSRKSVSSSSSKLSNYSSNATSKTNKPSLQRKLKQIYTNNRENLHSASSRKSLDCTRQKLLGGLDVRKIFKEKHNFPSITKITSSPQNLSNVSCKGDYQLESDHEETKKEQNLFSQVQVHSSYKDTARMLINSPTLSPMRRVFEIKSGKVAQSGDSISYPKNSSFNDSVTTKSSDNTKNCLLRKIPTTQMAYYAISSDDDSDEANRKVEGFNIIEASQTEQDFVATCCCCHFFKW